MLFVFLRRLGHVLIDTLIETGKNTGAQEPCIWAGRSFFQPDIKEESRQEKLCADQAPVCRACKGQPRETAARHGFQAAGSVYFHFGYCFSLTSAQENVCA